MSNTKRNLTYGYLRVSTPSQSLARQERNILEATRDKNVKVRFFREKYTGTQKEGRTEFKRLLNMVKPGDTIIFDSVCRMSRNASEGFADYSNLFNMGVNLIFLKQPHINSDDYRAAMATEIPLTDTPVDIILEAVQKYMLEIARLHIKRAFEDAEKEVETLRVRTSEGIETARREGKQIGRVPGQKVTTKKSIKTKAIIRENSKTFGGTLTDASCIMLSGVHRETYYQYKKELRTEIEKIIRANSEDFEGTLNDDECAALCKLAKTPFMKMKEKMLATVKDYTDVEEQPTL